MEGEGDGGCGPPTPPVSVLALIASAVRNEDTQGGLDSGSSVTQGKLSVVVVVVMKTSVCTVHH